jgi:hypothetical protein
MQSDVWEHRVLLFSIACHGILLWRLWSQKLAGVYRYLTIFLAGEALQEIAVLPLRIRSAQYGWTYVLSTPILNVLAYFVVLELYRLVLEDYPGIASVGRNAINWCVGLAVSMSVAYAIPEVRNTTGQFAALRIYIVTERSTVLGLLLFLVLIQLFLVRYRLRLSPNRMVYVTGYALYFSVVVAQDVIVTALGVQVVSNFNLWTVVAGNLVLLIGALLLSSKGEVRVQLESTDSSADRVRLQQQLADINRLLSRAARGRG